MPQEAALSPRRRQGLAGRAASCGLSDTCLPLSSWQVDFTSCTGLFCVLAIVMVVTGIITAIVLAFKYVSVPAELGSVNPVLRADFLYISVWQAPWASGWLWVPEPLNCAEAPSFGLGYHWRPRSWEP